MPNKILSPAPFSLDWAALLIRFVFCGLMVYNHAVTKYVIFMESPDSFPDPIGIGAVTSYYLVLFAEAICSLLVLLGLFTRLALLPLLVSMSVAAFAVHWTNSMSDKELPLLYLAVFGAIWLLGPGKYSVDWRLFRSPGL